MGKFMGVEIRTFKVVFYTDIKGEKSTPEICVLGEEFLESRNDVDAKIEMVKYEDSCVEKLKVYKKMAKERGGIVLKRYAVEVVIVSDVIWCDLD